VRRGLDEIVLRHETLRTTFGARDGKPFARTLPYLKLIFPVIDLAMLPGKHRDAEAMRLATEDARQPFDLSCGPLVRASLLRLEECDHVGLFNLHHIISDGWSMGILIRELITLYEAFSQEKPSPLPEPELQFADFAHWQRQWLSGSVLEGLLSYWRTQLGGSPALLDLPTDRPRPSMQSFRGSKYTFAVHKGLSDAIAELGRQEAATLFMTLLAAFQVLLFRYSHQSDISVGTPIANRTRREFEGLIGFFVNTLVLRTDLSGNPTFRELMGRVRETTLEAYAHQDIPFEKLQMERDVSRPSFFQVMFVLQNIPQESNEIRGLKLSRVETPHGTAKFDMNLAMAEAPSGIMGSLEYNSDLFDHSTIARFVGHFETLLQSIVTDPQQRLSDLRLLTEAERLHLLTESNRVETSGTPAG